MQRCARIVGAAACRCALRRLRHTAVSHPAAAGALTWSGDAAAGVALTATARAQSTAPDKRFHCSVCKKAFRLEMAAKLHLQQAHGGDGTVEAGAGPGQSEEQATPAPVGVFRNAPPQAPTVVTAVQPDVQERPPRREKPAPKPLHQAEREVPALVMEKMLSVWDDMGVRRMGNQFVHSSMVMRVFAARPSDSAEPIYGVMTPEGENPFVERGGAAETDGGVPQKAEEGSPHFRVRLCDAFAMATADAAGPCRPARCPNPFRMKYTPEAATTTSARADAAEAQTAPVTPFGQLPLFGQTPPQPPMPPSSATTLAAEAMPPAATAAEADGSAPLVSSPFAAGVESSPFAGTAATPFADAAFSPFAAAVTAAAAATPSEVGAASDSSAAPDSVGAGAVNGGAADAAAFTAGAAAPSPFASTAAAAASPFAAAAASPFAASPFLPADGAAPVNDFGVGAAAFAYAAVPPVPAAAAVAEAPPAYECAVCQKTFTSHEGLRMHSKAKHGVELLPEKRETARRSVPDLPAYIPSPVDLAMTSPFGSAAHASSWTEVELTPFAQSMSNITVAGKVMDVETAPDGSVLLAVFVRGQRREDNEVISVRCSAVAMRPMRTPFSRGEFVFASGTLRMLPVVEEGVKHVFASPVVHVTSPTGMVAKLNASP